MTQVQEYGIDNATNYPSHVFGYQYLEEYYVDQMNLSYPSTNCPAGGWLGTSNCKAWEKTWNGQYLVSADNGLGLHETFSYEVAQQLAGRR